MTRVSVYLRVGVYPRLIVYTGVSVYPRVSVYHQVGVYHRVNMYSRVNMYPRVNVYPRFSVNSVYPQISAPLSPGLASPSETSHMDHFEFVRLVICHNKVCTAGFLLFPKYDLYPRLVPPGLYPRLHPRVQKPCSIHNLDASGTLYTA